MAKQHTDSEHQIDRRDFLKLSAGAVVVTGASRGPALARPASTGAYLELGPMLGHVGPDEARVWVKASQPAQLSLRVWPADADSSRADGWVMKGPALKAEAACMGHARVEGLAPGTQYYYSVLLDDEPVMAQPFPSFTTAPPAGQPTHLRFAFTSCVGGYSGADAAAGWAELAARAQADLILMLGDNHYANSTEPQVQRRFYTNQRNLPGFRAATASTPTRGIWDDHDYGPNDSDRTAKGKERSLQTFQEHWANPAYGEPGNPGIYHTFRYGDIQFFMLDVRYHRDPDRAPADGDKTMLGEQQKAWLKQQLLDSDATMKFIASGSEWQPNSHSDSWASYDRERKELFGFIEDHHIPGVMLLSGDRHFTGAYQINGRLIEVTGGPMGSRNFPSENLPDMFLNFGHGKMYAVLDVDTRSDPPSVTLEVYRAGAGMIEERPLTWAQINGRERIPPLLQEKG